MNHFSKSRLTYIDATLGWPFYTHGALRDVYVQYMPKWPTTGLSYPTRILGDERSALVAFTDTPELFGAEIRSLAVIDIKDGKIVSLGGEEDMTLRTQILGRLAIERYLGRSLDKLPAGAGSSIVHVVGGDLGGGFEWQTAPAYRTTVRRGITAIALDPEGKVSRLTTVWDGAMLPLDEVKTLAVLSIE